MKNHIVNLQKRSESMEKSSKQMFVMQGIEFNYVFDHLKVLSDHLVWGNRVQRLILFDPYRNFLGTQSQNIILGCLLISSTNLSGKKSL